MTNRQLSPGPHSRALFLFGLGSLLGSLIFLYIWLQFLFLWAIEIPVNGIGQSHLCDWQYTLSEKLVLSSHTGFPFLVLLLVMACLFVYRILRNGQVAGLMLEFASLIGLTMLAGTAVFFLGAFINLLIHLIPGSMEWISTSLGWVEWGSRALGCKPVFPAIPGLLATTVLVLGLSFAQATGRLNPTLTGFFIKMFESQIKEKRS